MSQVFNVYCDESCHLENDGQRAMNGAWRRLVSSG
jgi:hypothetical protein